MSYPNPGTPTTPPVDPGVAAHAATVQHSATLPFTGGDVAGLAGIGLAFAVVGAVVVRRTRRARVA
jgi:hypothetical protein